MRKGYSLIKYPPITSDKQYLRYRHYIVYWMEAKNKIQDKSSLHAKYVNSIIRQLRKLCDDYRKSHDEIS